MGQGGAAAAGAGGDAAAAGQAGLVGLSGAAGSAGDAGTVGLAGSAGLAGASGFSGTGGNAGSAGVSSGGSAGVAGTGGSPACVPQVGSFADLLIYNGTSGGCTLALAPPRTGVWFAFDDGTAQPPASVATQTSGGQGNCSVRGVGSGATDYGGGLSFVLDGTPQAPCVYDAGAYSGIHLALRGSSFGTQPAANTVRVNVVTTTTSDEFGSCTSGCNDHYGVWCTVTSNFSECNVPFDNLTRRGFGSPATFSKAQILFVQLLAVRDPAAAQPTSWSISADDVTFY